MPAALRDAIGEAARGDTLEIVATGGALTLNRSHPVVQALAAHVVDTALDAHGDERRRALRRPAHPRRRDPNDAAADPHAHPPHRHAA